MWASQRHSSAEPGRGVIVPSLLPAGSHYQSDDLSPADSGHSGRAIWAVLRRRKLTVLFCVVAVTAVAVTAASVLPRRYTAESLVILDTRRAEIVQQPAVLSNLVSGSTADPAIVRTEVALISSPTYARKVVERLDLLNNTTFQTDAEPSALVQEIRNAAAAVGQLIHNSPDAAEPGTPVGRAINVLGRSLSIYNDDRSYAIRIRYESRDPAFAATVANTLAEIYVADQLAAKRDATHKASAWLKVQLEDLRVKLRTSERKVAEFEELHHLETVMNSNVTEQRMHELNLRLMIAADERAQKQATLAQVQDLLKSPGGAATAAQVLASPLIQKLREQQAEAAGRVASFKEIYTTEYPRGEQRTREIERQIATEIQRITTSLAGEVKSAQSREAALQEKIVDLQGQLNAINDARVQLKTLERDANANRTLYESFLLRSQQVEADEQSQQADARIIAAETPNIPSFPNKPLLVGLGFFGSLFLGIALAFVVERSDESIRSPEDAERLIGIPTLGVVPRVRNANRALAAIPDLPLALYSESINNILVALRSGDARGGSRVIIVSSALPGEGKTSLAAAIARSAAVMGARVLLLDCDLRRPAVGRALGQSNGAALDTMFEQNTTDLARFVGRDKRSDLHFLTTRQVAARPQELLGSAWMREIVAQGRVEYDLIVIDTPPLLTISDALLLAPLADMALLAVQWGRTQAGVVAEAARLMQKRGKCSASAILTFVDMQRYGRYRGAGYDYRPQGRRRLLARNFG